MSDIQPFLHEHLQKPDVMQLATARDGQPWACTVHFYADNNLHLYWMSTPERRHSLDIKANPRVAAAMAIRADRGTSPIGVQIEGDAELVEDQQELKRVIPLYAKKLGRNPALLNDVLAGTNRNRLYHLKPRVFVLFDPQTFPDDPRKEWRL
jgi:uncharacterized protein YhbP (UPF0306 family)